MMVCRKAIGLNLGRNVGSMTIRGHDESPSGHYPEKATEAGRDVFEGKKGL
jgi:hypothetical protein